ncbi:MAG: hypothetical protein OEM59_07310 [Rhodospirillales bacterium]|nr:hypothetical protein [Rhodospirillales bacterium]
MNGATSLPDLADWMMYGGGAAAVVGLALSVLRNRAEASSGMAQPLAVLGLFVFLAGLMIAVQQGAIDIGAAP